MQKTLSAKILLRECLNWLLCYVQAEIADNTFSPIILGSADSGRQNCRAVMLCQLLVRFVENDLILPMLLHAGFQVVALDDPGDTAEVFVDIHMGSGP